MSHISTRLSITSRDGLVLLNMGPITVGMLPIDAAEMAVELMKVATDAITDGAGCDDDDEEGRDVGPEDSCDD